MMLLLSIFCLSTTVSPVVSAIDESFYSSNDILYYDPDAAICSNGISTGEFSEIDSNDNLEAILKFFTSKGMSLAAAAGFAGNMKQESGLNPRALEPGQIAPENFTPINGRGFGLVQWTFDARQKPLIAFAKSQSKATTDMSMQLNFVWKEITEIDAYKPVLKIAKTQDPIQAAVTVHDYYEISADSDAHVRSVRGGAAKAYYEKYKSTIPDGTGEIAGVDASSSDSSGASLGSMCPGGGDTADSGRGGTGYLQCDPKWKDIAFGSSNICTSGCGVASMANIITDLTGQTVTPADAVKIANANNIYVPGAGSSWTVAPVLAKHYKLKSVPVDGTVSAMSAALKSGAMITMAGRGAEPFSSGGHYIAIRGINPDGKWLIYDSSGTDSEANTSKSWDPQELINISNSISDHTGSYYAISK